MVQTALHYSHQLIKEIIKPNDIVVDATMGNGHDTLYLAELVGANGHVYAFDVQNQAIENTKNKLLEAHFLNRVTLIEDSHEQFGVHVPQDVKIKAAIFNLGYLPKSDKQIITQQTSTLSAIEQLLGPLLPKGRIIIVAYYGHDCGKQELDAVTTFCANLPQENYQVLSYQFINQRNQPPILFCIEKK